MIFIALLFFQMKDVNATMYTRPDGDDIRNFMTNTVLSGDIVKLEKGKYNINAELLMDKDNVEIRGA